MNNKHLEYLIFNIYLIVAIAFAPLGIISAYLSFIRNINMTMYLSPKSTLVLFVYGWLNIYIGFKTILKIRECYELKEQ